jgi:hypothetical protein
MIITEPPITSVVEVTHKIGERDVFIHLRSGWGTYNA